MAKYLRNSSLTETLVEEDLASDISQPESLTIDITDSRKIHVGIETIYNEDIILTQEVFPKHYDTSALNYPYVQNLCVNGQEQAKRNTTNNCRNKKPKQKDSNYPKWIKIVLPVVFLLALLPGIVGGVFLFFKGFAVPVGLTSFEGVKRIKDSYYPYSNIMLNAHSEYPEDIGLSFVQRYDWKAKPLIDDIRRQILPVKRVIIGHSASAHCYSTDICKQLVKIIQVFHMDSQQFSDIGYNFLVGGDGLVYIGRGWNYVGAHTKQYNFNCLGIALIGTFTTKQPTELQMNVTAKLINLGIKLGKISKSYALNGMCQLSSTVSPGKFVYDIISKWDHFLVSGESPPCKNISSTTTGNTNIQSGNNITDSTVVSTPETTNSTIQSKDIKILNFTNLGSTTVHSFFKKALLKIK